MPVQAQTPACKSGKRAGQKACETVTFLKRLGQYPSPAGQKCLNNWLDKKKSSFFCPRALAEQDYCHMM